MLQKIALFSIGLALAFQAQAFDKNQINLQKDFFGNWTIYNAKNKCSETYKFIQADKFQYTSLNKRMTGVFGVLRDKNSPNSLSLSPALWTSRLSSPQDGFRNSLQVKELRVVSGERFFGVNACPAGCQQPAVSPAISQSRAMRGSRRAVVALICLDAMKLHSLGLVVAPVVRP